MRCSAMAPRSLTSASTGRSVVTPTLRAVMTSSPFWSRYSVMRSRKISLPARLLSFSQAVACLGLHGQHVAGPQGPVIFELLLGMQAAARGRLFRDAGWGPAGAEPRLAGLRAQAVFRIELRHRLRERRRRDDALGFGFLRGLGVVVDGIGVADRAREHHDVPRLDGKCDLGQAVPPFLRGFVSVRHIGSFESIQRAHGSHSVQSLSPHRPGASRSDASRRMWPRNRRAVRACVVTRRPASEAHHHEGPVFPPHFPAPASRRAAAISHSRNTLSFCAPARSAG